jgi:hypothetical protein
MSSFSDRICFCEQVPSCSVSLDKVYYLELFFDVLSNFSAGYCLRDLLYCRSSVGRSLDILDVIVISIVLKSKIKALKKGFPLWL